MFARNEGGPDRILRTLGGLGLLLAGLLLLGGIAGSSLGLAVATVGVLGLGTGASGFCVLYRVLRISTIRTSLPTAARVIARDAE